MSEDTNTAEAKLQLAETKLAETTAKLTELEEKLKNIPNNPEHFNQLKAERDEAKRKLKDIEDAQASAKGEFEKLAAERLAEIERITLEKSKSDIEAAKWTSYEKSRREKLLTTLTDEKIRKIGEKLSTLEDLEEFVEIHTTTKPGNSGNHTPPKPDKPREFVVDYK
jgi:predicted DNA binding CopG/RHH family protein